MAIRKTHVKSTKRQARVAAAKDAAKSKNKKDRKRKIVDTGFRFKGQAALYRDITVDLQSLLDDAVERYGRYEVATDLQEDADADADSDDSDDDAHNEAEKLVTPMSAALAELILLNTSLPFQGLHKTLYNWTRSLPLIIYHRQAICNSILTLLTNPNRHELSLYATHCLDLIPPFIQSLWPDPDFQLLDLQTILTPLMRAIVVLGLSPPSSNQAGSGDRGNDPNSSAAISKRAFQVLAWTFRYLGNSLFDGNGSDARGRIAWMWFQDGLLGRKIEARPPASSRAAEETEKLLGEEEEVVIADDQTAPEMSVDLDIAVDEGSEEVQDEDDDDSPIASTPDDGSDEQVTKAVSEGHASARSGAASHRRRLLASCFAFAIRQAKSGAALDNLVRTICSATAEASSASERDRIHDAMAWIMLEGAKSVDKNLHSKAPALFSAFLAICEESEDQLVLRSAQAALTALLHGSRADEMAPLVNMIIARATTAGSHLDLDCKTTPASLSLLELLIGVRKGSRLTLPAKKEVLVLCISISSRLFDNARGDDIARMTCKALLLVSDLEEMLSAGRAMLQNLCTTSTPATAATSLHFLADSGWTFFKDFAWPYVRCLPWSNKLSLLCALASANKELQIQDIQAQLTENVLEATSTWLISYRNGKLTDRQSSMLLQCLTLYSATAEQETVEIALREIKDVILSSTINAQVARENFQAVRYNNVAVLAATLRASRQTMKTSAADWNVILVKFGWHRQVLSAIAASNKDAIELDDETLQCLAEAVGSEDSLLRHAALTIAAKALSSEAVSHLLSIETIENTMTNMREKVAEIRRAANIVMRLEHSDPAITLFQRYYIALLKVNFTPIWLPAIESLSDHAEKLTGPARREFGLVILTQLRLVAEGDAHLFLAGACPPWALATTVQDPRSGQSGEFICTHNQRLNTSWAKCYSICEDAGDDVAAGSSEQITDDKLKTGSYEAQLLVLLSKTLSLTEQMGRDVLTIFFSQFATSDHEGLGRAGRLRLTAWLRLFKHFRNPKALYRSADLFAYLERLLSDPDRTTQKLALQCILTWKSPSLTPYAESTQSLLDDSQFRDALLNSPLNAESGLVQTEHRQELANVVIRILFGLLTSHSGSATSASLRLARQRAILSAFRGLSTTELDVLVDLMTSSMSSLQVEIPSQLHTRRIGYLTLLPEVIRYVGSSLQPRWPELLQVLLRCHDLDAEEAATIHSGKQRKLQQLSIKALLAFFTADPDYDFSDLTEAIFNQLISPRLSDFANENSQAPSSLLALFSFWSRQSSTATLLIKPNSALLPSVHACLRNVAVKAPVVNAIIDIFRNLLQIVQDDSSRSKDLLEPYVDGLLDDLRFFLSGHPNFVSSRNESSLQVIDLIVSLIEYVSVRATKSALIPTILPILMKPASIVNEKYKEALLGVLIAAVDALDHAQQLSVCSSICPLLESLNTRATRTLLRDVISRIATRHAEIRLSAQIIVDLNTFSATKLDEPDFDVRLAAYSRFIDGGHRHISTKEWSYLLHQLFFDLRNVDELSLRSNAAAALRCFVSTAGTSLDPEAVALMRAQFLPALRSLLTSPDDALRTESMAVLAEVVRTCAATAELADMMCLLANGDDEANFFNNIYHVQIHRRTRAMRRLAEEARAANISNSSVRDYFLPILSRNLKEGSKGAAIEVLNESIQVIGQLTGCLPWTTYNRQLQYYLRLAKPVSETQRVYFRVCSSVLRNCPKVDDIGVASAIRDRVLPQMLQQIDERHQADESLRIILAEGAAYLLGALSQADRVSGIANIVTSLAGILRSKAQDTRDLVRSALVSIVGGVGSQYLKVCVQELSSALQRGPQLHVLAVVVHAILVRLSKDEKSSAIDEALAVTVPIAYNDIFGAPARERDSAEFKAKTKFREVHQEKSMDTLEILAKHVSGLKLSQLISPVRDVLDGAVSSRTLQDVDEVLRHLTLGVLSNNFITPVDILSLCQALIGQHTTLLKPRKHRKHTSGARSEYRVQLKRPKAEEGGNFEQNAFKFVCFGLDLINGAFRRNSFDIKDSAVLGMLDPLIALVGDALFADNTQVLERSMRSLTTLLRCPLPSLDRSSPALAKQLIYLLEDSAGMSSELSQSCLRCLASIMRDRPSWTPTEPQVTLLTTIIARDMEDTESQPGLLVLLRALIARGLSSPQLYDLLDDVAQMAITNQSSVTREASRAIYLQFLLDLPQGKKRIATVFEFLAKNIAGYAHEAGRLSVLELGHAILLKFASDVVDTHAQLIFTALVLCTVNDDSAKCREMATENIKVLLGRAQRDTLSTLVVTANTWAQQTASETLLLAYINVAGILVELAPSQTAIPADSIASTVCRLLTQTTADLVTDSTADSFDIDRPVDSWQIPYHLLNTLCKIAKKSSKSGLSLTAEAWSCVFELLLHPHSWVRLSATRLVGVAFSKDIKLAEAEYMTIASNLALQLRSKCLSDELAMQITKNLFHIGKKFAATPAARRITPEIQSESAELNGTDGRSHNALHWLFVKLSHSARVSHQNKPSMYAQEKTSSWALEPTVVLRFFGAMIDDASISKARLSSEVMQMMIPIVRISNDPNEGKDPKLDELQTLAREVQQLLESKVGSGVINRAYNDIQRQLGERRQQRKRSAAVANVTNMEASSARKTARHDKQHEAKSRRNKSFADDRPRSRRP